MVCPQRRPARARALCVWSRFVWAARAMAAALTVAAPAYAGTRSDVTAPAAVALREGRYEDARRLADSGTGGAARTPGATMIAARAEISLGLYEQALARLTSASARAPRSLPLRRGLCEVLALRGDRARLKPLLRQTTEDWSARRIDAKNTDDLLAIAEILRLNEKWQDANDLLRAGARAAPHDPGLNVFWGQVFLERHALREAEASFRAALAADPDNPDAHLGLATATLRLRYDVAAAEREASTTLRTNRRHAGALALLAEISLDGEDFDTAAALLAEVRRTNARDARAASLSAARARLLDDDAEYRRERDAHAAVHPADGDFFAQTADILIKHRRTDDARAVAAEGVATDPGNAHCQSALGTTMLRLGDDAAGVAALREAWKRDPADARTYNLLELYEKVIPRMSTISTAHLSFRIDPTSRVAIERVVAPFLEETYERYAAKYGFHPQGPIVFELYADPNQFAIRAVGLPGAAVEAVCFGRVIASQSPTNGAMNWGMVLAHELAHVFAIELSHSRVPRWFTEGLAELETMRVRPEWTRHAERSIWGAAARGELTPLGELSNAFIRARDAEEATRAYAQSATALDYLDRSFGFAPIRQALVGFGTGARGLQVVAGAVGVSVADLERGFRSDCAARYARFDHQYLPAETLRLPHDDGHGGRDDASAGGGRHGPAPPPPGSTSEDWEARVGLAALRRGDVAGARAALARSRKAGDPLTNRPANLFLAGELALASRDAEGARAAFLKLLSGPPRDEAGRDVAGDGGAGSAVGADGYDVRVRLALAEIHRRDLVTAEQHLERAIAFDPDSAEATGLMVELLGDPKWRASREVDRWRAIGATLRLEPLHAELAKELVFGLQRRGRFAEVIDAAPLAVFIEPGLAALHAAFGRALAETGKPTAAAAALELALALRGARDEDEIRRLLRAIRLKAPDSRPSLPGATTTPH